MTPRACSSPNDAEHLVGEPAEMVEPGGDVGRTQVDREAGTADLSEPADLVDHRIGRPVLSGEPRQLRRHHDHIERIGATGVVRHASEDGDALTKLLHRFDTRCTEHGLGRPRAGHRGPPLPVFHGSAHRPHRVAPNPDGRMRMLDRPGLDHHAIGALRLCGPCRPHGHESFIGASPPIVEVGSERVELGSQIPDAHPEDDPAARQRVERGDGLRREIGLAVAENQQVGVEPQAGRGRSGETQRNEGVERGVATTPQPLFGRCGMVGDEHGIDPGGLGGARARGEVGGGRRVAHWKVHRHQHGRSLGSTNYDLTIHQMGGVVGVLDGKVVIVTGAGQGVGRCHAEHLASLGASVVVNDVTDAADDVVSGITAGGGAAVAHRGSVSDWSAAAGMVQQAIDTFGDLHVLVNNAGFLRDAMSFSMTEEQFDAVVDVHLKGHFAPSHHAAAYWRTAFKALPEGSTPTPRRIITTTSESGLFGGPGQANYGSAKGAIISLTLILARELERLGVTVNCIAPRARTPMTEANPKFAPPDHGFDKYDPANVSPMVAWLASDASEGVSAQVFVVLGDTIHRVAHHEIRTSVSARGERWSVESISAHRDELFADDPSGVPAWGGPPM
jgi:NAD(P)-dependent dehydrogenase (short-subunit alcohol dehydrogenase family)